MARAFTLEIERVVDLIKERSLELAPRLLTPAKQKVNGVTSYVCPFCGNGSGQSGDGLAWYEPDKRFTCFVCDNSGGGSVKQYDIIDIYQQVNSVGDNLVAIKEIAQLLGIEHNLNGDTNNNQVKKADVKPKETIKAEQAIIKETKIDDIKLYVKEYVKESEITKQLQEHFPRFRNELLTNKFDNIAKFYKNKGLDVTSNFLYSLGNVGYFEFYNNPNLMFLCDINKGQHISRQLNNETKGFSKGNGGAYCWNTDNLNNHKVVFVTEGETDCLTLLLCGYYAVSMTSANNIPGLFSLVANNQDKYFIVCYDNDEKGIKKKNEFNQLCNAKEIVNYIIFPISKKTPDVKDINDWYNADKTGLLEKLQEYFEIASQYWDIYTATQQEQAKKELADFNITNNIDTIINDIFNSTSGYKLIGDEYNELNNCIDGFKTGITVLGGGEGSGKTTLINQFIDNFAEQNIKTLVFSTEMLSRHIVARSTSRYHFNNAIKKENFNTLMYRNSDFLYGKDYTTKQYIDSDEVRAIKARLLKEYATSLNNNLIISDLVNDWDLIKKQIEQFSIANADENKVVVIDYLQNLTLNHDEIKADDEINKITFILMALKVLASKYNLVIVVLSSLNKMGKREGDTDSTVLMGTVNLAHLAELILILQNGEIKIEKEKVKESEKNKNGWKLNTDEKKIEVYRYKDTRFGDKDISYIRSKLAIVKNRYGANNKTIYFKFYQAFSYFAPVADNQIEQSFALKNIVGGIPTKENNRKETEFAELEFDKNGNIKGDKDELERLNQSNNEIPFKDDDDDDLDTGDIN